MQRSVALVEGEPDVNFESRKCHTAPWRPYSRSDGPSARGDRRAAARRGSPGLYLFGRGRARQRRTLDALSPLPRPLGSDHRRADGPGRRRRHARPRQKLCARPQVRTPQAPRHAQLAAGPCSARGRDRAPVRGQRISTRLFRSQARATPTDVRRRHCPRRTTGGCRL